MKHCSSNQKRFVIGICCIFILILTILPAQAARRSHGLAITLLASGVGLQVGSTMLHTSAESRYEEYLSLAIQDDIQNHKNDVVARENASVIMSRVGFGCIGLAVILSIFNQLHNASIEITPLSQTQSNVKFNTHYPINFTASPILLDSGFWSESQEFSVRPHFDFEKQRASLQFLHRF
ncbi:hypothetical protein J4G08_08890 [Candidatus Poribacteria bacterium]|nr:hypothetical protein [Candidatus Poribacteria bacterium]